jgi:hypothetical protein
MAHSAVRNDASEVSPALGDSPRTIPHWTGGKFYDGSGGRFGEVYNPSTGALEARVPFATAAETASATGRASGPSSLCRL